MKVFLLRHGTRNFTTGDVPLNQDGQMQAAALAQHPKLQSITTLLCSPKLRAQMTLQPLSEKLGLELKILPELDQLSLQEEEKHFHRRAETLTEKIAAGHWPTPLLLCSHSDWLGAAAQTLPCDDPNLKHHLFRCAELLEFDIADGLWLRQS